MSLKIDFVLPTTGNHGWVVSEGWVNSAAEAKMLGNVFRPKANWGDSEPETDDGLLQCLKDNNLSETIIVLGMDWHSQPLTKLNKWKDAWKNCQSKVVAIIWEDYTSEFVFQQKSLFEGMVNAAHHMIDCADWIYSNHEENVYFFNKNLNCKKIGYLPFSADLNIFKDNEASNKIYDKLCFKGFIKNFGFKSGPYHQREYIVNQLTDRLGDRFVFNKDNVSDQDYAKIISKYFFQINLPSFSPSMTARAAEVMAAGGFLFQFTPSGEITNEHFQNGREMAFYEPSDIDGLIAKIEYYLENKEEAIAISKRAHAKFISNFSMPVQLRYIAEPWKKIGHKIPSNDKITQPAIKEIIEKLDINQILLPARLDIKKTGKCSNELVQNLFSQLLHTKNIEENPSNCDILAIKSLNRKDYNYFFNDVIECFPKDSSYKFKDISFSQQTHVNTKALKCFIDLRPIYDEIDAESETEKAFLYIKLCMYYYVYTCIQPIHYKILVCFADMQPVENLIAQLARSMGLITVTLQHGLYVDYGEINTVNRVNYEHQPSEYFLAWGSITARLIQRYHPSNYIFITGKPDIYIHPKKINYQGETEKYVTIIMDQHWYENENINMLRLVANYCLSKNIRINVKFHPSNKEEIYKKTGVPFSTDLDITRSIFIVGHTSSLAYEYLTLGCKVFFYNTEVPRPQTDKNIMFSTLSKLTEISRKNYPRENSHQYIAYTGDDSRSYYRSFFLSLIDKFRD